MNAEQRKRYATHAEFLAWTLTPDLKEMQMLATAKDVRLAATMISELMGQVDRLTHLVEYNNQRHKKHVRKLELEIAEAHLYELGLMED